MIQRRHAVMTALAAAALASFPGAASAQAWPTKPVTFMVSYPPGGGADLIARHSGKRPTGWLGAALAETWHTLDFLADEGFQYVADWTNDDQPYLIRAGDRRG